MPVSRPVRPLGHELTAALAVGASAEELDVVGDDLDGLALRAVLCIPLAPLEPALHGHRAALGEVLRTALALLAQTVMSK